MTVDSNIELISSIPIFRGLSQSQISAIVAKSKKTFFEVGEKLVQSGASGDTAYVIVSGKAVCEGAPQVEDANDILLPGTLVGELAMLVEMTYTTTVIATQRVRAIAINRPALVQVMEEDPAIARHFSDKLMQRLLDLAEELKAVDAQFAEIEASFAAAG
jgi:CRP-like cAMP-binding protein